VIYLTQLPDLYEPVQRKISEYHYTFTETHLILGCTDSVFILINLQSGTQAAFFNNSDIYKIVFMQQEHRDLHNS